MPLSETARERLADIVDLQPTKNAELQDRWEMDSGSEVHSYLEGELKPYYFRDDDSMICATVEAEDIVAGNGHADGERTVRATGIQAAALDVLPGPDEEPQSVVATLNDLRAAGHDPEVEEVRSALHGLADRGVVARETWTVPTFRLALPREKIQVEALEA